MTNTTTYVKYRIYEEIDDPDGSMLRRVGYFEDEEYNTIDEAKSAIECYLRCWNTVKYVILPVTSVSRLCE